MVKFLAWMCSYVMTCYEQGTGWLIVAIVPHCLWKDSLIVFIIGYRATLCVSHYPARQQGGGP